MPRGENCTMTASGYGTKHLVVEAVSHGINIVASEASGKKHRVLYITRRTSGSFSIEPVFSTFPAYEQFYNWFRGYCARASDPDGRVGQMRVRVPSRNFDKTGVPSGTYTFGDDPDDVLFRMVLMFVGTKDPAETTEVSAFYPPVARVNPRTHLQENLAAPYYYPGGTQLGGTEKGQDYLYDNPPNESPMRPGTPF